MRDYNHVTLVGNLIDNPKKYDKGEITTTQFVISVHKNYRKNYESEADFIPIVSTGKLAEILSNNLKKGNRVLVDGKLHATTHDIDGQQKYIVEIIADEVTILSPPTSK